MVKSFNIEKGCLQSYQKDIYNSLSNMTNDSTHSLICFRKIDKYLYNNLINSTVTVTSPSAFNDPFDCPIYKWLPLQKQELKDKGACQEELDAWISSYDSVKICCFAKEYDEQSKDLSVKNLLMWSHYADKHEGLCLKYELKNSDFEEDKRNLIISRFGTVRYRNTLSFSEIKELRYSDAFLLKQKCWEYENEYRLVHYEPLNSSLYQNICIPRLSLKEIYFGLRCSDEDVKSIRHLLYSNKMTHVKLFKMKENKDNLYCLNFEKLC